MTTSPELNLIQQAAPLLSAEERLAGLAAVIATLTPPADRPGAVLSPSEAVGLDGCAEVYVPLVQFMTKDFKHRGVWLKAPTLHVIITAENRALAHPSTIRDPQTGERILNERLVMAYQIEACTRPRLAADTLLYKNVLIAYHLHARLWQIAELPSEVVHDQIQQLAGGPAPAPTPPPAVAPWGTGEPAPAVPQPEPAHGDNGDNAMPGAGGVTGEPGTPADGSAGA